MLDDLKATRKMVAESWCKGDYAKDSDGYAVGILSPRACSWCLVGAVLRATMCDHSKVKKIFSELGLTPVSAVSFNDRFGQEAVLALLDKVIENGTP